MRCISEPVGKEASWSHLVGLAMNVQNADSLGDCLAELMHIANCDALINALQRHTQAFEGLVT